MPVPPQFGFYKTRWRRWDAIDLMPASQGDAATPAGPPRSIVPGVREEDAAQPPAAARAPDGAATLPPRTRSPAPPRPLAVAGQVPRPVAGGSRAPLPPPARGTGVALPAPSVAAEMPPVDPAATGLFIVTLSRDAVTARSGSAAEQDAFTQRLIPELLAAHDPEARKAIIETAADFDTPAAAAICAGGLEDPSPAVRTAAYTACARRDGVDAVPLLARRCAADPDAGVRVHAIEVLGRSRDPQAITALAATLDDPDPAVRGVAIEALRRASGRDLGDDPAAWRRWAANPDPSPRRWSMSGTLQKLF